MENILNGTPNYLKGQDRAFQPLHEILGDGMITVPHSLVTGYLRWYDPISGALVAGHDMVIALSSIRLLANWQSLTKLARGQIEAFSAE